MDQRDENIPVTINICPSPALTLMAAAGGIHSIIPLGSDELAIAGALVNLIDTEGKGLVLCDEPTGDLDPETGERILDLFQDTSAGDFPMCVNIVRIPELVGKPCVRILFHQLLISLNSSLHIFCCRGKDELGTESLHDSHSLNTHVFWHYGGKFVASQCCDHSGAGGRARESILCGGR